MYHFNSILQSTGIDQSQQIQVDDRPAPLALKDRTKDWSRPLEPLPARKRDIGTTANERRPYVRLIRAPVNRSGSRWAQTSDRKQTEKTTARILLFLPRPCEG